MHPSTAHSRRRKTSPRLRPRPSDRLSATRIRQERHEACSPLGDEAIESHGVSSRRSYERSSNKWCVGLAEGQFQLDREPRLPRRGEVPRVRAEELAKRMAELPAGEVTRISVGRLRGERAYEEHEYIDVVELGGFHVSGASRVDDIARRFGSGSYRVTAYGFSPPNVRWEVLVDLPSSLPTS
jgi:hypothetical protein